MQWIRVDPDLDPDPKRCCIGLNCTDIVFIGDKLIGQTITFFCSLRIHLFCIVYVCLCKNNICTYDMSHCLMFMDIFLQYSIEKIKKAWLQK